MRLVWKRSGFSMVSRSGSSAGFKGLGVSAAAFLWKDCAEHFGSLLPKDLTVPLMWLTSLVLLLTRASRERTSAR